jgi:hypothetical protein
MATNVEALAGEPPAEQEELQRFTALQNAEIATVKASVYPAVLASVQRKKRLYPEGVWPEQMVRDFREELALAQKYDLDPISPEEYAVREAAADEKQGGFQVWRDADDAVIRFMDRAQLASIIAGAVASFLVKAEVSAFNLNELTASDPLTLRPANHQGDGPVRAYESNRTA